MKTADDLKPGDNPSSDKGCGLEPTPPSSILDLPSSFATGPLRRGDWLALGFAMIFPTLATWLYFIVFAGDPWAETLYRGGKIIQFTFPLLWCYLAWKRPIRPAWRRRQGI